MIPSSPCKGFILHLLQLILVLFVCLFGFFGWDDIHSSSISSQELSDILHKILIITFLIHLASGTLPLRTLPPTVLPQVIMVPSRPVCSRTLLSEQLLFMRKAGSFGVFPGFEFCLCKSPVINRWTLLTYWTPRLQFDWLYKIMLPILQSCYNNNEIKNHTWTVTEWPINSLLLCHYSVIQS